MTTNNTPTDLEKRFIPPSAWSNGSFVNPNSPRRNIAYNTISSPQNHKNLIILPGLSEFGEKYVETAMQFFEVGYNIFIIDWAYQGRSKRFLKNREKRHSDGYAADLSDLDFFINNHIGNQMPLYMLGHSMGAHLGLRYLCKQNHNVIAASFSAPMLKIKSLNHTQTFYKYVLKLLSPVSHFYVPGGHGWLKDSRELISNDIFSSDPVRRKIHNQWSEFDPELRIGSPTLKWLKASLKSISILERSYQKINTPIFLGVAENDMLVDNDAIIKAGKSIPSARLMVFKNSKHEILMEKDNIRTQFLDETLNLFNQSS